MTNSSNTVENFIHYLNKKPKLVMPTKEASKKSYYNAHFKISSSKRVQANIPRSIHSSCNIYDAGNSAFDIAMGSRL